MENRIKEIIADRQDRGVAISQESVAQAAGISVFTLNRIANGKQTHVTKHIKRKIAAALKLPFNRVFPDTTPKRTTSVG